MVWASEVRMSFSSCGGGGVLVCVDFEWGREEGGGGGGERGGEEGREGGTLVSSIIVAAAGRR